MSKSDENLFFVRSEQYAQISEKAYADYLSAKNVYLNIEKIVSYEDDPIEYLRVLSIWHGKMDDAGVVAIVFQAMAIESYANLMGAFLTDEEEFYGKHERAAIDKKLSGIIESLGKTPPTDLLARIKRLFDKRNDLVHQKPRAYCLRFESDNVEVLTQNRDSLLKEVSVSFSGIEEDVNLYSELKEALKAIRGTQVELLDEIINNEGEM